MVKNDRLARAICDVAWSSFVAVLTHKVANRGFPKEILEQLPKLTHEEKRQLWNVLNHEVEEETPEVLAAIYEGIRSLESGERTYTRRRLRPGRTRCGRARLCR